MKIATSFRVLANLEYAFMCYLNWKYHKLLEFKRIHTADFAFAYGLSEAAYNFELNHFLCESLKTVRPVIGAYEAVADLRSNCSELFIITRLDVMHRARLASWVANFFNGWRPLIYHTDSMANTNRNPHWFEKDDICFVNHAEVFVTDNPVDAQQVARLLLEVEVMLLEMPWNLLAHPCETNEYGSWEEVATQIKSLAR